MPANFVLLEKIVVGAAGASGVTFSGIPQTGYTDLVVKMSCRFDLPYDQANLNIRFNSDSGANYSTRRLKGTGAITFSDSSSAATTMIFQYGAGDTLTANTFSNGDLYIPNYTSSNYKSVSGDIVIESNSATNYVNYLALQAGLWSNTAAITSITIGCDGNWKQYSTFYLYGVAKLGTTPAIVPYATGGDTIMTDGTYWYHAFKSSGTFTPAKGLSCDVMVIAGGGGGGTSLSPGAGAGGFRVLTSQSLASGTGYTATIGGGGAAITKGTNSSFAGTGLTTITSTGGGKSGNYNSTSSGTGGSGGGGLYNSNPSGAQTGNEGGYSPVEGFAGGAGTAGGGNYASGGGGGAGAVGSASVGAVGGNGGVGTSAYSSWGSATETGQNVSSTYYYAGGGGGGNEDNGTNYGTGGYGGGGRGGNNLGAAAVSGTANTGGGAGGSSNATAATGGSGLVIVRYAV
jgi:hypothetical protein